MDTGIISVAGITVISYLAAQAAKVTKLENKWLPIICGTLGGVLGILGMWVMPDFPAGDPLSAAAVGIVSGLAATGSHEIFKQMGGERK